jgi:transposase, IS6 family
VILRQNGVGTSKNLCRRHSAEGSQSSSNVVSLPDRDARAAKRFFCKMLKTSSHSSPRVINVDKNPAFPPAVEQLKEEGTIPNHTQLRQSKYLNNLIEQDHRFIKRRVNAGLGFFSFKTAGRTIKGYEAMQMVRKGQIEGVAKGDVEGQVRFVESLFKVAA